MTERDLAMLVGQPVALEVRPAGIDPAHLTPLFYAPLERALLDACRNEPGRAHVASRLHRVVIQCSGQVFSSRTWCTLENGVLTLDHAAVDLDDVEERAQRLVRVLEQGLQ